MLPRTTGLVRLDGDYVFSCAQCRCHLANREEIVSKAFHGRRGRAYLFNKAVNLVDGPKEERMLLTGMHTVCDVMCQNCNATVGWKYIKAAKLSQRYKVGKVIIERATIVDEVEEKERTRRMFEDPIEIPHLNPSPSNTEGNSSTNAQVRTPLSEFTTFSNQDTRYMVRGSRYKPSLNSNTSSTSPTVRQSRIYLQHQYQPQHQPPSPSLSNSNSYSQSQSQSQYMMNMSLSIRGTIPNSGVSAFW